MLIPSYQINLNINFTCRLTIVNKKFEGVTKEVEPWYGSCYSVTKLDPILVETWKNIQPCSELHLPARNDFIPTNFDLYALPDNPPRRPLMIKVSKLL